MLSWQQVANTGEDTHLESLLEQRLAPINQFIGSIQQQQQQTHQATHQETQNVLSQFAQQNEFFEDVRDQMADVMDMGRKQGVNYSLGQAYDYACSMHPQIKPILEQRAAAAGSVNIGAKKNAASSVTGTPGTKPAAIDPTDLRSQIEAAWNDAEGDLRG